MQLNQKRPNHAFFIFLGIAAAYAGYCFATLYGNEIHMENITELFIYALRHPLPFVITQWTAKAEAACIGIWLIAYLSYLTNQKNYMPGKEYGSARLAAPDEINRKLANKDPKKNKIVSEHVRISTELPAMNNNALIIGGSGAGKSFYIVKPNGYTASGSYLFCDPKGELLRDLGGYLELQGYRIVVLDLIDMDSSDGYNPFAYLRSDEDIVSLITNLIANTTPPNAHSADPFWEKAEGMYLQSIMLYVWYEYPKQGKEANFRGVLELLNKAKIPESENELSELDELMYRLPEDHPALVSYKKVCTGAADTVRSIIISAHSRLAYLQNPRVLRLLDKDEIDIAAMGEGVYQNPDRPTALFCKIPDNDKSYNFIVGMLYTQMFQELYRIADRNEGGKLPVPVAFWMDEFANVMLPKGFCELLSTMRGRQISCNIIIQNLAQIKALFKDTWETIPGNCDVLVYLGGNEASTHKYISEQLGKLTIDKKSTGETLGSHGSSSRNYDVIGREILSPDEIRKLDPKKCLILVKGYDAVVDWKYQTWKKQEFKLASSLGDYLHKKELDQMYLESRQQFYLSSAGIGAIMSYQIQVEDCGGIFEETDIWKLTLKTEEGYIRMPDSMKGYNYFECEVFPAFSPEAIKVQSGKNRLSKHCIAGFYDSEENLTLEDEEILESIFIEANRLA